MDARVRNLLVWPVGARNAWPILIPISQVAGVSQQPTESSEEDESDGGGSGDMNVSAPSRAESVRSPVGIAGVDYDDGRRLRANAPWLAREAPLVRQYMETMEPWVSNVHAVIGRG